MSPVEIRSAWPMRPFASVHQLEGSLRVAREAGAEILHATCRWHFETGGWEIDLFVDRAGPGRWGNRESVDSAIRSSNMIRLGLSALNFYQPIVLLETAKGASTLDQIVLNFCPGPSDRQGFLMALGSEIDFELDWLMMRPNEILKSGSPEQIVMRTQCAHAVVGQMVHALKRLPNRAEWAGIMSGVVPAGMSVDPLLTVLLSHTSPPIELLAAVVDCLEHQAAQWRGIPVMPLKVRATG